MEAFPLHWPVGYKRTNRRYPSQFKQTMEQAQQHLRAEVKRIGGKNLIVSSNIPVRNDGSMYAVYMSKKIEDPGVAVYFDYKGKQVAMCCDQYERVWENIYALGKGIESLRAMNRWGVSDFLDRAFTGFTALPESIITNFETPEQILGIQPDASQEEIKAAYLKKAKETHPDAGGSTEAFQKVSWAYQSFFKEPF